MNTPSRVCSVFVFALCCTIAQASQYFINTVAGGGDGSGAPATSVPLSRPFSLSMGPGNNLHITDLNHNLVRKVDTSGVLTTVAGNGQPGNGGDFGPATQAQLYPAYISADAAGNLYIVDFVYNTIRKVDTTGTITTIAGTGTGGAGTGDDGPALQADFGSISAIVTDSNNNIYVSADNRIRKITTDGIIHAFAGDGTSNFSGDGGQAAQAAIGTVNSLAVDSSNNLYLAAYSGSRIRKITVSTGIITSVAGTGTSGYSGDGGAATAAKITATAITADANGQVFLVGGSRLRKITTGGIISTICGTGVSGESGDGGPATAAQIDGASNALAAGSDGSVYICEQNNSRVRRINPAGTISTYAGNGTTNSGPTGVMANLAAIGRAYSIGMDSSGNYYIGDTDNFCVWKVSTSGILSKFAGNGQFAYNGDGGPALNAGIDFPLAVAPDNNGNVYILDLLFGKVRKVNSSGTISTVVSGLSTANTNGGLACDAAGNLYIACSGANTVYKWDGTTLSVVAGTGTGGFSGDNGPATAAMLHTPSDVALDAAGNIYIADNGNHRLRKVTASTGVITTLFGGNSSLFSGDGGPAIQATGNLNGVSVDVAGNLYFTDNSKNVVRMISAATGTITSIAGNGQSPGQDIGDPGVAPGDGGPALLAQLGAPIHLVNAANGDVYLADDYSNRVRHIFPSNTPGSLSLAGNVTVAESAGVATISVTRTGGANGAASVHYATADGSAKAGSDYTSASGTLSWADGDAATKTFTVTILNSTPTVPTKAFSVNLTNAAGASLGTPSTATVTITYQMQKPTYTLTVIKAGQGAGTVTLNPPGGSYQAGTLVTLSETPNAGSVFASWSGPVSSTSSSVKVTMNSNLSVTATFNLSSSGGGGGNVPVITSPTAVNGTAGSAFSYQITATNNPTGFGASNVPAWLTINPATGVLSGTPPAAGTFTLSLTAQNAAGTGFTTLTITIGAAHTNAVPAITSELTYSPNPAFAGQAVTFTVGASDGSGGALTYSWQFGDGGTDTASSPTHVFATGGTYTVSVTVANSSGASVQSSATVTISGGGATVPPGALPLTVSKLSGAVTFKTGKSTVSVLGTIPNLPTPLVVANQSLTLSIGGAELTGTLNAKGQFRAAAGQFAFKLKRAKPTKGSKTITYLGGTVTFSAKLSGAFASTWGLSAGQPAITQLPMAVVITFRGNIYGQAVMTFYAANSHSAKFGVKGH